MKMIPKDAPQMIQVLLNVFPITNISKGCDIKNMVGRIPTTFKTCNKDRQKWKMVRAWKKIDN